MSKVSLTKTLFYAEPLKDGSTREWYITGGSIKPYVIHS